MIIAFTKGHTMDEIEKVQAHIDEMDTVTNAVIDAARKVNQYRHLRTGTAFQGHVPKYVLNALDDALRAYDEHAARNANFTKKHLARLACTNCRGSGTDPQNGITNCTHCS